MGFTSCLDVRPKYMDYTFQDTGYIGVYLSYENNSWAQERYESAEEYCKKQFEENPDSEITEEAIQFYRDRLIEDEFGHKHIYKDYAYWCSNGIKLHEFITSNNIGTPAGGSYTETILLSKEDVCAIMNHCLDLIEENVPVAATIKHSYKYQRDENGDILEDSDIVLSKCDGFEVEFEDGCIQRFDTNPEYGCEFGFPKSYFDESEFYACMLGLKACSQILAEVDFEANYVSYCGGW